MGFVVFFVFVFCELLITKDGFQTDSSIMQYPPQHLLPKVIAHGSSSWKTYYCHSNLT